MSNTKYGYIGGVESSQGGSGNSGVFSTSEVQDLVLDDLYGVNKVTRGLLFEYDAKDGGMSGTSVLDISGNGLHATAYNGLSISTSEHTIMVVLLTLIVPMIICKETIHQVCLVGQLSKQ